MKKAMVPAAVLLLALAVPLLLSIRANGGHFLYTLDDPYIHLALSENIARGHYGINQNECTAPSSSILWPFLLAPLSNLPFSNIVPLFLNTIFALLTVVLIQRFYRTSSLLFTVVSIFTFNLVGLVLTGMEHSLQLFLVTAIAFGTVSFTEKKTVAPWFASALVLAPLVRYECLAVSLPVLFFLFCSGERKNSVLLFLLIAILLGGFSLFLVHLGLNPLPASVNAKSMVVSGSGSPASIFGNLLVSVKSFRGIAQLCTLFPLLALLLSSGRAKEEKLLAGAVAVSVVMHLFAGRSGWFHRYGVYIWAFSILMTFHLYSASMRRFRVLPALALLILSADYLSGYCRIASASSNIYQQQYQMRMFVHEWLKEPVAVNDLGLVSMGYDEYVLDLWGLAVPGALEGAQNSFWVDSAAIANGVNTAIVYRDEIRGIQHWTQVARMEISPPLVVCAAGGVDFLAAPWASPDSLRNLIEGFSLTLPAGINLTVFR